jgi:hypothetical protein
MGVFPPGYISTVNPAITDACDQDAENANSVDVGPGWAWGSMLLPQMEQQALFNSVNFSLSVAFAANNTCSTTLVNSYLCPSDSGKTLVPVLADPPDPANPGSYGGTNVVDTVAKGNYVGMFGLGEICAASGAGGTPNVGSVGSAVGIFYRNSRTSVANITDGTSQTIAIGERSHNLSYVTWTARSIGGWLGTTPASDGGSDRFNPSPE